MTIFASSRTRVFLMPVSYTHLDVYKRQAPNSSDLEGPIREKRKRGLDVYKRQLQRRPNT